MGGDGQNTENAGQDRQRGLWEKAFDIIREEYHFLDAENADTVFKVIAAVTENPGTTVQEVLDILEDAKRILLRYRSVC